MEDVKREEWVKWVMHDFGKVEGLDQPDGSKQNARITAEYY